MKKSLVLILTALVALTVTMPVSAQSNPPSGDSWSCFEFAPVPVGTVVILTKESPIDQIWIDGSFFYESIEEDESDLYMILDLGTSEVRVKKEQSPQIGLMCYHMLISPTETSTNTAAPTITEVPISTKTATITETPISIVTPLPTSTQQAITHEISEITGRKFYLFFVIAATALVILIVVFAIKKRKH
jgi:hypothetical protein